MQNIRIFTTSPPCGTSPTAEYLEHVRRVAQWSDRAGCEGILVYTDNSMFDPWLMAQLILQNTRTLAPLVAVQPVYMHPFAVAKMVSTLSVVHQRRMCLNMVAGGFKNDLTALNDLTPHQLRYDRLVEYTAIIKQLLAGEAPVTFQGHFYTVQQLSLKPALPKELFPTLTISGSSPEGIAAARALDAIPVRYPEPSAGDASERPSTGPVSGVRVGIIARPREDTAWECAQQRFPSDRAGKIMHGIAMKVSDSLWHKQLSDLAGRTDSAKSTYWLEPFQNYKTFCPYLVGSYEQVALELRKFMREGCGLFILDVPATEEDLEHVRNVFEIAGEEKLNVAATNG